jgi:hypothetical protein
MVRRGDRSLTAAGRLGPYGAIVELIFRRHLLLEIGHELGRAGAGDLFQHPFPPVDQLLQFSLLSFRDFRRCRCRLDNRLTAFALPLRCRHRRRTDRFTRHSVPPLS